MKDPFKRLSLYVVIICFVGTFFGFIGASASEPNFPSLTGRVVDNANLLNQPQRSNISSAIEEFEDKTSTQIVVVTLSSLQGYEIRDYGYQLGRHWQIGQKDKNNGVILLVAPIERKVAIEVGYGLEGVLTDALSRLIIEHKIIPSFKQGDYAQGIKSGVETIIGILAKEVSSEDIGERYDQDEEISPIIIFILIIVLIIILNNMSGGRGSRRGSSWSGPVGGGWSGGGGGFSGGGGSFGGGGASGGW